MKAGQVVGQSVDQLTGLFGRASRSWAQTIRKWTQDPNAYQSVEPFAERVDLDNGTIVSIQMAPVYWRAQFLGTVSTFRDITHEVQVERLKSEFLANVSHELRTPMTSIKGYVEIMLMGAAGALSDQQHHFLDIIKENTQRLGVLVNDLLDISRMEAGRVHLTFTKLDLAEIARDVVEDNMRRSQEENKPITFRVQAPKDLPPAMGDAERVRQILGNLAGNGYNYTPADGTVVISLKQVKDEIQVDVKDNGIGIAPEVKHRIFDRFYRGEDPLVLATAGTGLGLAVSKTLVEMHHGRIWFVSNGVPGDGSTFSFTLPLVQPEE
jgi:signal transduction histidine kinase